MDKPSDKTHSAHECGCGHGTAGADHHGDAACGHGCCDATADTVPTKTTDQHEGCHESPTALAGDRARPGNAAPSAGGAG